MRPLAVGDRLPPFELPDQHGGVFRAADALARGPLVLFFYPKDGSPGCTAEVCSFRDASDEFLAAGAQVVGVSSDDVASHRAFAAKHRVSYPLLADVGGALRRQLGVPRGMLGLVEGRVTYVVGPDGVVLHVYDAMVLATRHVDEALTTVRGITGAVAG